MLPYCIRAIAYLKVEVQSDEEPIIQPDYPDNPVVNPLGHGLLATYLVDEGSQFTYLMNRHLEEEGTSIDELHLKAVSNLSDFAEQHLEVHPYGNIFAVLCGGTFESSLLMLDLFWTDWYGHLVQTGFVVAIPARDILAFGELKSEEAISELHELCNRIGSEADHALTDRLYKRVEQTWQPLGG